MKVVLRGIDEIDAFVNHWKPTPVDPPFVRFTYIVKINGITFTCQELNMDSLTVGKQAEVTMGAPKDKFGNDTTVDGAYTFNNLNPELVTITPNADGTGFTILAGTTANQVAQIEISADVDRGDGVTTHTETLPVALQAGDAATFSANFGPETDPPQP